MDTNPFPTGYGNAAPQQPGQAAPQMAPATTPMGGVGNMVQALMGGYNKYLDKQAAGAPGYAPAAQPVGQPMQIHPPVGQQASLGNSGLDANGNMAQALFNPNQISGLY